MNYKALSYSLMAVIVVLIVAMVGIAMTVDGHENEPVVVVYEYVPVVEYRTAYMAVEVAGPHTYTHTHTHTTNWELCSVPDPTTSSVMLLEDIVLDDNDDSTPENNTPTTTPEPVEEFPYQNRYCEDSNGNSVLCNSGAPGTAVRVQNGNHNRYNLGNRK